MELLRSFSKVNLARCDEWHRDMPWTPLEFAGAMCGEAGEASNVCKKLRRIEGNTMSVKDDPQSLEQMYDDLAFELADTLTYADLTVAAVNRADGTSFDLWEHIDQWTPPLATPPLATVGFGLTILEMGALLCVSAGQFTYSIADERPTEPLGAHRLVYTAQNIAAEIHRDLWQSLMDKFNRVSEREGMSYRVVKV